MYSSSSAAHFSTSKLRKKKNPRLHQCLQISLLSGLAFINSGRGGCSLRELYAFIVENFEGFDIRVEAWKKSIRHSLCTHVDIYVKDHGEGNWKFKDEDLYYNKLNHYIEKNSNYYTYGLKNPQEWNLIRTGTKGLPVVLSREEQKLVSRKRKAEKTYPTRMKTSKRYRDAVWAHYQPMALLYSDDVYPVKPLDWPSYAEASRYHDQYYYYNPVPYGTIQLSAAENHAHYGHNSIYEMNKPFEIQSSAVNMPLQPADYQDQCYYYKNTAYGTVPVATADDGYYETQEAEYEMNEPQTEAKLPLLTDSFCDYLLAPEEATLSTENCYNGDPYAEAVPEYEECHYPYDTVDTPYYQTAPIDTYAGEF